MSFSWDWFINLYTNDSVDDIYRGGWQVQPDSGWTGPLVCPSSFSELKCGNIADRGAFNDTLSTIKVMQPNLMFLYLGKCHVDVHSCLDVILGDGNSH